MFINKEAIKTWLNTHHIKNYTIHDDLSVDVNGDVDLSSQDLKSIPVQFKKIAGDFDCHSNSLTNLKGCPMTVIGDFDCYENQITSLIEGPKIVSGCYNCSYNQLTDLKGVAQQVDGTFSCVKNKLSSLSDGPKIVQSHINARDNAIYDFKNFNTQFGGYLILNSALGICPELETLYNWSGDLAVKMKKLEPILLNQKLQEKLPIQNILTTDRKKNKI